MLAITALIAAGLALPTAGNAAKPTASLEFEVPDEGRVGFNHVVFKTKKGKPVSRGAAKRFARGSEKLSKKVRVKARLSDKSGIPESVQVVAAVAQIKGEKNLYALDVAVLHAGPGAQALSSAAGSTTHAAGEPVGHFDVQIRFGSDPGPRRQGPPRTIKSSPLTSVADSDVTGDDPDRPTECAPGGDFADYARRLDLLLSGNLPKRITAADVGRMTQLLFCDLPIPGQYADLFDLLDLDRPPSDAFTCTAVPAHHQHRAVRDLPLAAAPKAALQRSLR